MANEIYIFHTTYVEIKTHFFELKISNYSALKDFLLLQYFWQNIAKSTIYLLKL